MESEPTEEICDRDNGEEKKLCMINTDTDQIIKEIMMYNASNTLWYHDCEMQWWDVNVY